MCTLQAYRIPDALQRRGCVRALGTCRTVLLLPYYSTRCLPSLLSQRLGQVGLCQIPTPKAEGGAPAHAAIPCRLPCRHGRGRPLGCTYCGGGCSRDAADLACRPDSEQITLPQGRSSASSLPAKPTQPPIPTPTGSRLAGTAALAPRGRQHRSEPRARHGGLRGLRMGGALVRGCS